jgi:MarR family transcriptional regulator, temperature-dependent positive regulator of motility
MESRYTDDPFTDHSLRVMPDASPAPVRRAPARMRGPRPTPLHEMPGHLFRRLHQQGVALYGVHAAGFDLTPVQFAALSAIAAWPDSDQSSIGRAIACDKATVGAVLDRLEGKGLVERVADAADRRAWRLRATPAGLDVLERIAPKVAAVQRELLAPLGAEEVGQLMGLLARLVGPLPVPGAGK